MAEITISPCPSCGSESRVFCFESRDHLVSKEDFKIWECLACSLRFTYPVPGKFEIGKYYQSDEYISHTNSRKGIINKIYQLVRKKTTGDKLNLVRRETGKQAGKILDIGCGTGEFLFRMASEGWDTKGLEPDVKARELAIETHKLDVSEPSELFEQAADQFDAISMWHVLEHIHDLHPYMKQIHKIIRDDGALFVAVPNTTSHDARIYKSKWAAYDVPRHLYHFSPEAMKALLDIHGFRLKKMRRMPFDSFYVSMLSEKMNGGNLVRGLWVGFKSWWKALSNVKHCSSIIYVAEKLKSA